MDLKSRSESLMGTTVTLSLAHPQADQLLEEAFRLLRELEHRFNANSPDSELMAINRAAGSEPVRVHPDLLDLIGLGKEHSLAPDSHLNIAIGPLVDTWRIGFQDARKPQPAELETALTLINPQLIEIDSENSSVLLAKKGMKIDLGALAKGYSADRVAGLFRSKGVTSALINLGGNILTLGSNESRQGQPWNIGIQNPLKPRGHYLFSLPLVSQSMVTSGIYERYLELDGRSYHHILDSRTGYPINSQLASLTIISDQSLDGEIWTSRLFGQNPRSILDQVNELKGLEAILINHQGQIAYSQGISALLHPSKK